MRRDLFLILCGGLLLLAMLLTLRCGRQHSRHGYGQTGPGLVDVPT